MNGKKQLAINMLAQVVGFVVSMGISFFLTPYIIRSVGSAAYGFVGLANDFTSYAELAIVALNSMASRFITIKIHQNDNESANKYFASVVYSNIVFSVILLIPSVFIILFLDRILSVPHNIYGDVQFLFAFILADFIVGVISSTFNIATFAQNKLYLASIQSVFASIIRVAILLIAFACFPSHVWFIGLAAITRTLYIFLWNVRFTRRLLPQIHVSRRYFDVKSIIELISSGIWNVVTKLSQIFIDGLDLLIANVLINAQDMGVLAVAKTVPNIIFYFIVTVAGIFNPHMTILYAKNNKEELIKSIKLSMKFISAVSALANAFLLVFGAAFFTLWIPSVNSVKIQVLSLLTVGSIFITGPIQPIYQIITITNKVKKSSLAMLIYGVTSIIITLACVKLTSLGIYAIAGVSCVLSIFVALFFHIPYGARCLGLNWKTFYPEIGMSVLSFICVSLLNFAIRLIIPTNTWFWLVVCGCISGILGLLINAFLLLDRTERAAVWLMFTGKFRRNPE